MVNVSYHVCNSVILFWDIRLILLRFLEKHDSTSISRIIGNPCLLAGLQRSSSFREMKTVQTTTIMAAPLVHVDLQRERDGASFDLDQLTYIFDGGRETTEKRRSLGTYNESVGRCHSGTSVPRPQ